MAKKPRDAVRKKHAAQALAKGYKKDAHREQDAKRKRNIHGKSATRNQQNVLDRYLDWHCIFTNADREQNAQEPLDEAAMEELVLGNGVSVPSLCTIKDFFRFHVTISRGRIKKQMTVDSTLTNAEWFCAGFERITGSPINRADRSEINEWIRRVLAEEGLVVYAHRDKFLLGMPDLVRLLRTLWTKNDLAFVHERYRVQFTFILRIYCWTGARLGAFFDGSGLRYGDVELLLHRNKQGEPKLVYKIQQRWVKGNRHPEDVHYDSVGKAHPQFIFDDASFLFALAIADGALYGFESIDDLKEQQIPPGDKYVRLPYKEEACEWPILRKCDRDGGVTKEPMAKAKFLDIYRETLRNAGYNCSTSIHSIRRALGKKVDEKYSPVQRSQHLTQADPRVFGQSYVANCSSVDGQAAYLGESTDHEYVELFQRLEIVCADGCPCQLTEEMKDQVERDEGLIALEDEVKALEDKGAMQGLIQAARKRRTEYRTNAQKERLKRYQAEWKCDKDKQKIRTRGKERFDEDPRDHVVACLSKLMPQRKRIAEAMSSDKPMSWDDMWDATRDLHALCTLDLTVAYLPGHWPVNGACPARACSQNLKSMSKRSRNRHVHRCMWEQVAQEMGLTKAEVHYCYRCYEWCSDELWEKHCQSHVPEAVRLRQCGNIFYCLTAVCPNTCPFCLGDEQLPARTRLLARMDGRNFQEHLEQIHLQSAQWPMRCPHPRCETELKNNSALHCHFADVHGIRRSVADREIARGVHRSPSDHAGAQDIWGGDATSTDGAETFFTPEELTWTEVATSSPVSLKTDSHSVNLTAKQPLEDGDGNRRPGPKATTLNVRYASYRPGQKRKFERMQ